MRPFSQSAFSLTRAAAGCAVLFLARLGAAGMPVDPELPAYEPRPVEAPSDARYLLPDGSIRVSGADHAKFILEGFGALFGQSHPAVKFTLDLKGTTTGIPFLAHGLTPFAPLGRDINPHPELVQYKELNGAAPLELRVAHASNASHRLATSLGIYVNKANPLDRLTMDQVARIFTWGNPKGDYGLWGQVGLKGSWARRPIRAITTPSWTGFGIYMEKFHFGNRRLRSTEAFDDSAQILRRVGEDPAAIGFAAIGRPAPDIKMLALAPKAGAAYSSGSPEDVVSGAYPLHRYLYFYVRRAPGQPVDPFVKEYFRMVFSRDGQQIVASEPDGYLPLTAAQAAAELAKLD
jgi:phosphate transport system substrate-binding protein